jgi:hypothetical protein
MGLGVAREPAGLLAYGDDASRFVGDGVEIQPTQSGGLDAARIRAQPSSPLARCGGGRTRDGDRLPERDDHKKLTALREVLVIDVEVLGAGSFEERRWVADGGRGPSIASAVPQTTSRRWGSATALAMQSTPVSMLQNKTRANVSRSW